MDSIRDQHLDPPEAPTHDTCKGCGEEFDWDNLNDEGYCLPCEVKNARGENDL